MNGILVINKPRGWTSHDVVNKVRRIVKERRVGHTGTLDPLATGVLVLCVGKATRIARYLESDDKEYTAAFHLGIITDTLDSDGRAVETRSYTVPSRGQIDAILCEFVGEIRQRPPAYSALKVNGIPSYRLARSGQARQHPERPVTIHSLTLLDVTDPVVRIKVHCSKGTYIRTLCADIGDRLGMGAHVTALNRDRSGRFLQDHAVSIDQIEELLSAGREEEIVVTPKRALDRLPEVVLTHQEAGRAVHGNALSSPAGAPLLDDGVKIRLVGQAGELVAIGTARKGMIYPETVLA